MEKLNFNTIVSQDKPMSDVKTNNDDKVKKMYIVIAIETAMIVGLMAGCVCIYLSTRNICPLSKGYRVNVHNKDGVTVREDIDVDREHGVVIHHVSNQAILTHRKLGVSVMRFAAEKECYIRELMDDQEKELGDEQDKGNEEVIDVNVDEVREYNYVKSDRPVDMTALGDNIGEFCKGTEISWVRKKKDEPDSAPKDHPQDRVKRQKKGKIQRNSTASIKTKSPRMAT
ncbi:unnamed protein product, partial [Owenia fusiformis]